MFIIRFQGLHARIVSVLQLLLYFFRDIAFPVLLRTLVWQVSFALLIWNRCWDVQEACNTTMCGGNMNNKIASRENEFFMKGWYIDILDSTRTGIMPPGHRVGYSSQRICLRERFRNGYWGVNRLVTDNFKDLLAQEISWLSYWWSRNQMSILSLPI